MLRTRESSDNSIFEVRNPYTNAVVGTAASASSKDCQDAIESAARALETWQSTLLSDRREVFLKISQMLQTLEYKDKVIALFQAETGASLGAAVSNWHIACAFIHSIVSSYHEFRGEYFPSDALPGSQVTVQRRPIGVIFSVCPWNLPAALTALAVGYAILCGNTVVLKPSEYSPKSQALIVDLFHKAGLPSGVLNFLPMGKDVTPNLTAEIIAHPLVRKISFIGSESVGRIVAMEAAKLLKPCVLELGGNAPSIVFSDANIDTAAKALVYGAFSFAGQACISTERVLVQRDVSEALNSKICDLAKSIKAGEQSPDIPTISSLVHSKSAAAVIDMIREAQGAGAQVLVGDMQADDALVQPHIIFDVKPGMKLWECESFGPVLCITAFDTLEEAISLANNSKYSLTSSVWTSNMDTARQVSNQLRSGYTHINGPTSYVEPAYAVAAAGGGSSGYGRFDVNEFTYKHIIVTHPVQANYPVVV
ncbi:aldehyde dehydrogenase domain-containing protein [Desarmillaria ectypa]|nr:aldehyde dehydrogenase domain-containing protein [Desarmillaria ectypa]